MTLSDQITTIAIGLIATTTVSIFAASFFKERRSDRKPCLPYAPASMWTTIQRMSGAASPQFILEQARELGMYSYRLALPLTWQGTYIVGDGELAREILMDPTTDKAPVIHKGMDTIFGRPTLVSVLNTNPYTRSVRKGTSHAFSQREVRRMNGVAAKYAKEMIKRIAANSDSFDPALETTRLTCMVICEAAFEYENASEEEFLLLSSNFEVVFRELLLRQQLSPWRTVFGRLIPDVREAYQSRAALKSFLKKLLANYQRKPHKSPANTLIKLIDQNEMMQGDDEQKASELLLWAFAGFDTTGFTLSNTLILLAQHPDVQTKLRESMAGVEEPHTVTYFQNVVKESIRLVPVSAVGSIRQTGRDFQAGNYKIPQGAVCFLAQYVSNCNPNAFENPNAFDPERWENPTPAMQQHFFPFSVGARNCPGQSLAMSEINLALPLLVSNFHFEVVSEGSLDCFTTFRFAGYRLQATPIL